MGRGHLNEEKCASTIRSANDRAEGSLNGEKCASTSRSENDRARGELKTSDILYGELPQRDHSWRGQSVNLNANRLGLTDSYFNNYKIAAHSPKPGSRYYRWQGGNDWAVWTDKDFPQRWLPESEGVLVDDMIGAIKDGSESLIEHHSSIKECDLEVLIPDNLDTVEVITDRFMGVAPIAQLRAVEKAYGQQLRWLHWGRGWLLACSGDALVGLVRVQRIGVG